MRPDIEPALQPCGTPVPSLLERVGSRGLHAPRALDHVAWLPEEGVNIAAFTVSGGRATARRDRDVAGPGDRGRVQASSTADRVRRDAEVGPPSRSSGETVRAPECADLLLLAQMQASDDLGLAQLRLARGQVALSSRTSGVAALPEEELCFAQAEPTKGPV